MSQFPTPPNRRFFLKTLHLASSAVVAVAMLAGVGAGAQQSPEPIDPTNSANATTTAPLVAPALSAVLVVPTTTTQVPSSVPEAAKPEAPKVPETPKSEAPTPGSVATGEQVPAESSSSIPIDLTEASTTTSMVELTTVPALQAVDDEGDAAELPPKISIPVLPPPVVPVRDKSLEDVLKQLTQRQQTLVVLAQKKADIAGTKVAEAEAALTSLGDQTHELADKLEKLNAETEQTRAKLRSRAIAIFAGEDISAAGSLLDSSNANDLVRSVQLVSQTQQRDRQLLTDFFDQQASIASQEAKLATVKSERESQLETYVAEQQALGDALNKMREQLASITTGASIALGGFVFPVTAPFNFADTFGAPRMVGTKYYHLHQGTDIFGAYGSPLLAVQRGVVTKIGRNILGGNRVWLHAEDGTEYYYAHLSAFVEGMHDGDVVEAGQTIGFLGTSGNAQGTPSHLHFEVHPGGGAAVNPFPFLEAVRTNDAGEFIKAMAGATSTTIPALPGQISAGVGIVREVALETLQSVAMGPNTTVVGKAAETTLPVRAAGSPPSPKP